MIYALTTDNTITQVGALPKLWYDGARWHDWRTDSPATDPADYGWLPVTDTPRPDDTDTTTHERSIELIDGTPTVMWTPRPWTAEELAARAESDARLDDLAARVARIEAKLWPAVPDPEPDAPIDAPTWGDLGGIWPNGQLLSDGGTVWRNVSGVPLTTPPSGFPGEPSQWTHLFVEVTAEDPDPDPDPDPWPQWRGEWSADAYYTPGDHVTRNGVVYRCIAAHGPEQQGGWGPPTTGVWVAA